MRAQHALMGPVLTNQHHAAQLAFTKECQNWQVHHWQTVPFTGKDSFTLSM